MRMLIFHDGLDDSDESPFCPWSDRRFPHHLILRCVSHTMFRAIGSPFPTIVSSPSRRIHRQREVSRAEQKYVGLQWGRHEQFRPDGQARERRHGRLPDLRTSDKAASFGDLHNSLGSSILGCCSSVRARNPLGPDLPTDFSSAGRYTSLFNSSMSWLRLGDLGIQTDQPCCFDGAPRGDLPPSL